MAFDAQLASFAKPGDKVWDVLVDVLQGALGLVARNIEKL